MLTLAWLQRRVSLQVAPQLLELSLTVGLRTVSLLVSVVIQLRRVALNVMKRNVVLLSIPPLVLNLNVNKFLPATGQLLGLLSNKLFMMV